MKQHQFFVYRTKLETSKKGWTAIQTKDNLYSSKLHYGHYGRSKLYEIP